jgi:hypothetical protein
VQQFRTSSSDANGRSVSGAATACVSATSETEVSKRASVHAYGRWGGWHWGGIFRRTDDVQPAFHCHMAAPPRGVSLGLHSCHCVCVCVCAAESPPAILSTSNTVGTTHRGVWHTLAPHPARRQSCCAARGVALAWLPKVRSDAINPSLLSLFSGLVWSVVC